MTRNDRRRKADYLERVTRGEGFMPWQPKERESDEERAFRAEMERRKERLLARRMEVRHPVLLPEREIGRARKNVEGMPWARAWYRGEKSVADHLLGRDDAYIGGMIPELTPTNPYGLTCPNCVGSRSQEGMAYRTMSWDYRDPEVVRCAACGQAYPEERYPETGLLVCPRRGQTFAYYLNGAERGHPDDRTGRHAWKWVGKPVHSSFSGFVRGKKVGFMISGAKSLALVFRFTGDGRYAETAVRILDRLAACYRNWLYHDFYDTVADCDPLYAAWHDMALKLVWKRHRCAMAYGGLTYETGPVDDTPERAKMLATYFGCGRIHPSADGISGNLGAICLAYDLVHDARGPEGGPLWSEARRQRVERDLILECLMTAEPFVGGDGRPADLGNKSPYVYQAQAVVGRCLGLPGYAEAALRGYEGVRDRAFLFDGLSKESPAYTNMYLSSLVWVPETLHGFGWPPGIRGRRGKVDLYRDDARLRLMVRAARDQLRPDGRYLPFSDTEEAGRPSPHIFEIGRRRYPRLFAGQLARLYGGRAPTEYGVFRLDGDRLTEDRGLELPETCFPAWGTAILRHGTGPAASVLALPFNPPGGHRQPDNLSLYYVDRGRTVLGDLGYVGDSPMNRWIRGTSFSHNLVTVDDQEQPLRSREPSFRMMVTSPRVSVVEASSRVYPQCRDYRRMVILVKGPGAETFVVDIFRVKGGARHTYRLFSELAASDAKGGSRVYPDLDLEPDGPLPDFGASVDPAHIFGLRDARRVENPPPAWQAIWQERGRRYRLRMLSPVDAVEVSNGPGQETLSQIGRRVRYLDAIRTGEDLASAFVAIHEPVGPGGVMPVRGAERVVVSDRAGPDAVALRIVSRWGTYLIFSDVDGEVEVDGIRFEGAFGVHCRTSEGRRWILAAGARTMAWTEGGRAAGFSGAPAGWSGRIRSHTEKAIETDEERPAGWPRLPQGVESYVRIGSGQGWTGFPVRSTGRRRVAVGRFSLQGGDRFDLPAVRCREEGLG